MKDATNMEGVIVGIYFAVWLLCGISLLIASKLIKDIKMKTTITKISGIVNTVALLIAANILFYSWKTPVVAILSANLMVIAFIFFGSKNVKYCQKCGAMNQWVMFRKYCSKCGSLIESNSK